MQEPEDVLVSVCDALLSDVPCIDTALKNFLAKCTGEKTQGNDATHELDRDLLAHSLDVVRWISRHINSMQLPPLEEWLFSHPQTSEQTATERIDEVINYRAAHFASVKVRAKCVKFTKAFGRQFLRFVKWSELISSELETETNFTEEQISLVREFVASVQGGYADDDLVWTSDFHFALQQRRQLRQAAAEARNEKFEQSLRDAVLPAVLGEEEDT